MMDKYKVNIPWTLKELKENKIGAPKNGLNVFSCFHCGGGSTMGYKLAGFNVLGGVEIDKDMMNLYRKNHEPKEEFSFLMPIQTFKTIENDKLPKQLFNLDILDGSPPCSSFSMAGSRDDAWGKEKKFREGQSIQILDDLFFHYIQVADKLKPKIIVAENVKGLILGKAKGYVKEIFKALDGAGYETQLFLLNSAVMGVPQVRERTFFISRRKDLKIPKIEFNFNEEQITAIKATIDCDTNGKPLNSDTDQFKYWHKCMPGQNFSLYHPKGHSFNSIRLNGNKPVPTITSGSSGSLFHWLEPRKFSKSELIRFQSFPDDYDFLDQDPGYVCGMSVPPLMMQRIALELSKILQSYQ